MAPPSWLPPETSALDPRIEGTAGSAADNAVGGAALGGVCLEAGDDELPCDSAAVATLVQGTLPCLKHPQLPCSSSSESLAVPHTPAIEDAAEAASEGLPPADGGRRRAFVTLLTRDSYLPGVQTLARSLQAVQARHPLIVMYTPDTLPQAAVEALLQDGCLMRPVERYTPAGSHNYGQYKLQLYAECWTKLRLWEMEGEYDRLVYLDADMLVLRNIDAVFDLPPGFYAVGDCTAGRQTQAERDGCPLFCPQRPHYFNAGFFVMEPSRAELALFHAMLAAGSVPIGGYAEQDLLNHAFKDTWRSLPHSFNAQRGIRRHHPQLWRQHWPEVAVIHYTDTKPWEGRDHPDNKRDADLVELWWQAHEGRLVWLVPGVAVPPAVPH